MSDKITKWYHKMGFWQWIGYIVTPITVTGEGAILHLGLDWRYQIFVVIALGVAGYIKYNIKDDDGDGIADKFQKKP